MYAEIFKNDTAISFLHILFNVCFSCGKTPKAWGKGVISPIPKSSTTDPRDPLSYRGITLAPVMYKLYSHILNARLTRWIESNSKLNDEQNGFRSGRSTLDHISTLTSICETRIKNKKPTFAAFIDFSKAYDSINRDILWSKLSHIGLHGKLHSAIKSLYSSVTSCVRVNSVYTDWFDVAVGLRQGCSISPTLFNCFIDDLITSAKSLNIGIDLGDEEKVSILVYADDVLLLTENEEDLQTLLNLVHTWTKENHMKVNCSKSNIVHFRPKSFLRTRKVFKCGDEDVNVIDKYVYLGLHFNEFLDFNTMAKFVAQAAGRAFGLLVVKYKAAGGMPFSVFTKLYNATVLSVINYGSAIWGTNTFSCIEAIHNRAMRFYLGTGKYTPNAALIGDMGWEPIMVNIYASLANHWARCINMDNTRINKQVFLYSVRKSASSCKNWTFRVKRILNDLDCNQFCNTELTVCKRTLINRVKERFLEKFKVQWNNTISRVQSNSARGLNKLRTYRLFKKELTTETYVKIVLPFKHRSAFAKFRCGVAPLRLETGRYERLDVQLRVCPFCKDTVENELHVVTQCPVYDDIRNELYLRASTLDIEFNDKSCCDKFVYIFSSPSMVRVAAKSCFLMLRRRTSLLYTT